MLGHGAKFDQKMEQAIAALLSHRSIEDAAREVGISPNTLARWMKEPEFKAKSREARRTVFSQAIGRLEDAAGAAATTILKIMLDPNAPAPTRLRAAEVVLEQAAQADEIENIAARVETLERAAASASKTPKRSANLTWVSARPLPGAGTRPAHIDAPRLESAKTGEEVIE